MSLGAGLAAQFGGVDEATNGTQLAVTKFLEINPNDTLAMKKNPVQGQGLRAPASGSFGSSLVERGSRRVIGSWEAAGDVNFDIPFSGLGFWLKHMMGAFNPGTSAGTNNPLVQQQSASAAYLQTYALGSVAGHTMCVQKGVPDATGTVRPFTYPGTKVSGWQVDFDINQFAKITLSLDSWQELTPDNPQGTTAGQALSSAVYTASQQFFHFRQALLYKSGTVSTTSGIANLGSPVAAGRVKKGQVKLTRPLDNERMFVAGTAGTGGSGVAGVKSEQLENNYVQIGGNLDVEFFDLTDYYDNAAGDTTMNLWLEFVGPIIASSFAYTFAILIPYVKFETPFTPLLNTPGVIQHNLPFKGLDDEVNTPIQVQYMSTDTTP